MEIHIQIWRMREQALFFSPRKGAGYEASRRASSIPHQNEACNTQNSNIQKLHNRMLLNQHSFHINPLDAEDIYFQDYSSSSQGNYLSAKIHSDVNLTWHWPSTVQQGWAVWWLGSAEEGEEEEGMGWRLATMAPIWIAWTTFGENVYDDDVSGINRDFSFTASWWLERHLRWRSSSERIWTAIRPHFVPLSHYQHLWTLPLSMGLTASTSRILSRQRKLRTTPYTRRQNLSHVSYIGSS